MKTKSLCKIYGGSHLYHLNTPESDIDERGVFMHLDPKFILGTRRFDEERRQPKETDEDVVLKEISHYCSLLAKSNTEALELLFCDDHEFTELTEEFRIFRKNRYKFIDSVKMFGCLRGYMQGERRLMNGERKGQIGGKRYAKLQEVGYSPKNAVQLIRLANVGIQFFRTDSFFVNVYDFPNHLGFDLMKIKTRPEEYSKEEINLMVDKFEKELIVAFENRKINRVFDEEALNQSLFELYMPVLKKFEKSS